MITPDKVKAARKLLGWSVKTLAMKSHLPVDWLHAFERDGPGKHASDRPAMIVATLERAGVDFTGGDHPGLKLEVKEADAITPDQIKAARKLVGWSVATLAKKSCRSSSTIAVAEAAALPERYVSAKTAIRAALENAGAEFMNEGQPGVRLRETP